MKETFFNIRYLFGKDNVWKEIDRVIDSYNPAIQNSGKGYIIVADGVVANIAQRIDKYKKTVEGSLFAICDSGWIPLYLRKIYGFEREQYCGPQIFIDFVKRRKHKMFFMGTSESTLIALKAELTKINPDIDDMVFYSLPYRDVEDFDYSGIAKMVEDSGADIIWVALGAPKQCYFMERLYPYLKRGVMLGVGAAFKFHSGTDEKRAPLWMRKAHIEFIYRIMQDPKKQISRCWWIVKTLPKMYSEERSKKKLADAFYTLIKRYKDALQSENSAVIIKTANSLIDSIKTNQEYIIQNSIMNKYWLGIIEGMIDVTIESIDHNLSNQSWISSFKNFAFELLCLVDKDSEDYVLLSKRYERI